MSEQAGGPQQALRVGFVAGVMPDRWAQRWRERTSRPLDLVPVTDAEQEQVLRDGTVQLCVLRLPVERGGLHVIALYDEDPVVVAHREHPVAAFEEITLAELAEEPRVDDALEAKAALDVIVAEAGIAIWPRSVARLHRRKDVVAVPVTDAERSQVALVWSRSDEDPDLDTFVGVVRGRTANSSRGTSPPAPVAPSQDRPRRSTSSSPPASGKRRAPARSRSAGKRQAPRRRRG